MEHIARRWGRYEAEFAASWILENSGIRPREQALSPIAATWVISDPLRAAGWAADLPKANAQMGTMAAEWLNQQPTHRDYDGAVRQVALATMHEVP